MPGIWTTEGNTYTLQRLTAAGLVLHLFSNQRVPLRRDTVADYIEPTKGGYAPIVIPPDDWTIEDGVATTEQVFVFDGPAGDIHGFYLTGAGNYDLVIAERLENIDGKPAPERIRAEGDKIIVTVSLRLGAAWA